MLRIYIMNFLLAVATTIGMTVIPFLITDTLGLSLFALGLIEGVTEFLSNTFRLANGVLFDKIKNKRNIFVFSTGLAFLSKALLLLPFPIIVLFAKTLERVANGTFAAPRDAFVAGNAKDKGIALGWLNVSKTIGCVIGPIVVAGSVYFWGPITEHLNFFIIVCCSLSFPALLFSFTLTVKHVEEKIFSLNALTTVCKNMSPVLLLAFLFFLGRFNDGLLTMFLRYNHYPEWFYASTIAIFNTIMMIVAPVIGSQIDKGYVKRVLYVTILALCIFNACFYNVLHFDVIRPHGWFHFGWVIVIFGLSAWGIQRAGAQIVFSILVFRNVEKAYYGTAIGIFYIISGLGTMLASFLCGYMANKGHFIFAFLWSGFFACLALGFAAFWFNRDILLPRTKIAHAAT